MNTENIEKIKRLIEEKRALRRKTHEDLNNKGCAGAIVRLIDVVGSKFAAYAIVFYLAIKVGHVFFIVLSALILVKKIIYIVMCLSNREEPMDL